ncbi:MAG: glutathione S-transferase N-terminal domain-containing protein [Robiginitomaculum sp.]|nr:glutathione S-transferase N-terminal domain-containing protein [Robiginitomaculum sp.]
MRPWLVLKKAELPFEEKLIQLDVPGYKEKLLAVSDAGTVPVLQANDEVIADSLAISEWAAKCVPNLWPKDPKDKQLAQEFCKQMQDDFVNLRNEAPMNLRRRTRSKLPKSAMQDAERMQDIWLSLLSKHDGPYLFNDWSIADAFVTPYASRFVSYGIARSSRTDTYISELMSDEDFLEWEIAGLSETWKMPDTDAVNT